MPNGSTERQMDISEAIIGRRAVREYAGEPVSEVPFRRLIEAAVQAPSAVNQQPWTFTVVRDQALLDRVSKGCQGPYARDHAAETPFRTLSGIRSFRSSITHR